MVPFLIRVKHFNIVIRRLDKYLYYMCNEFLIFSYTIACTCTHTCYLPTKKIKVGGGVTLNYTIISSICCIVEQLHGVDNLCLTHRTSICT